MKNTTKLILGLSIALLLSLGGNVYQNNLRKNEKLEADFKNIKLLNENAVHKAASDSAANEVKRIQAKLKITKDSVKVSHKRFVSEIGLSKKKLSKLPQVIPQNPDSTLLDSIRTAYHLKDTIISQQDEFIKSLELTHAAELLDMNAIISAQAQQITSNMAIGENWRQMAETAQKGEKKQKRGKVFWRTTTLIVTGAAAILIFKP